MYDGYGRRQFFQFLSLLTSSILLACANNKAQNETQKTQPNQEMSPLPKSPELPASLGTNKAQVIIIGAGISGLAAARELNSQGINNLVLEGRSRVGGRVYTDQSLNNLPLDVGASWIHGVEDNPIYQLAQTGNINTLKTNYDLIELYGRGKFLSDQEQEAIEQRLEDILEQVEDLREQKERQDQEDISLKSAIEQIINQLDRPFSTQQLQELDYALNTTIEHEYAADIANLSLYYWDDSEEMAGGDVLFPKGYGQIVDLLVPGLDLRLNQVVQKITYSDQGVIVTTNQGDFLAEKVIITLPLGVLKKGVVEFSPPLPPRKIRAIERLGMGVLNKVYLQFPEVFWDRETHLLGYVGKRGEWAEWLNIYRYTQQPVLLGFNAGEYGEKIEGLTDGEIVAQAMAVLRQMYGSQIPNPTGSLITRWRQDPFSYGSYSYAAKDSTTGDRQALGQPVDNRLFFAGEATSQKYPATVHGAFLSGLEAAQKIK
jgi:monoamine oxidase